jgi:hypothetical protein
MSDHDFEKNLSHTISSHFSQGLHRISPKKNPKFSRGYTDILFTNKMGRKNPTPSLIQSKASKLGSDSYDTNDDLAEENRLCNKLAQLRSNAKKFQRKVS